MKKGSSVLEFLEQARGELEAEFVELRGIHAVDLMYVKEDLILPHVSYVSFVSIFFSFSFFRVVLLPSSESGKGVTRRHLPPSAYAYSKFLFVSSYLHVCTKHFKAPMSCIFLPL